MSSTTTASYTYTATDIEKVARRFRADMKMIAQNTGAVSEDTASRYADDIETLAKCGFLRQVDVTLLSGTTEMRAAVYTVNEKGGDLTASAPGGVMWPRVTSPELRVVVSYNSNYNDIERAALREKLRITWTPSQADLSHAALTSSGGRDYASNGYAFQRKDFSR